MSPGLNVTCSSFDSEYLPLPCTRQRQSIYGLFILHLTQARRTLRGQTMSNSTYTIGAHPSITISVKPPPRVSLGSHLPLAALCASRGSTIRWTSFLSVFIPILFTCRFRHCVRDRLWPLRSSDDPLSQTTIVGPLLSFPCRLHGTITHLRSSLRR